MGRIEETGPAASLRSRFTSLLGELWLVLLSLACALVLGYAWRLLPDVDWYWGVAMLFLGCGTLSFMVPELWWHYAIVTMLPPFIVSIFALDQSTHNLLGIEIIFYAFMILPGMAGSWVGRTLTRKLFPTKVSQQRQSLLRATAKSTLIFIFVGIISVVLAADFWPELIPTAGIQQLKWAIQKGDINSVRKILEDGTNPNSRSQEWTMLMHATKGGNYAIVKLLLERGADPNAKSSQDKASALTIAAERGFIDIAELLLQRGANVNGSNAHKSTPLMYSAEYCHVPLVTLLLKAGADVTLRDKDGETALMIASRRNHMEIVEILKRAGAREESPLQFPDKNLSASLCPKTEAPARSSQ